MFDSWITEELIALLNQSGNLFFIFDEKLELGVVFCCFDFAFCDL